VGSFNFIQPRRRVVPIPLLVYSLQVIEELANETGMNEESRYFTDWWNQERKSPGPCNSSG